MADFTPIETQEAFDEAVKNRLARERAKYADYDKLKADAATHAEKMANLGKRAEAAEAALAKAEKKLEESTARLTAAELSASRLHAAAGAGIPLDLAERLTGGTADELKADAEKLAKLLHRGAPGRNPEPTQNGADEAMRKLAQNLGSKH